MDQLTDIRAIIVGAMEVEEEMSNEEINESVASWKS